VVSDWSSVLAEGGRVAGRLEGRLIGLGVTGSIAAYKAPEIVRGLQAEGAEVVCMLTPSASRFVSPLTLQALSRHTIETDVLSLLPDDRIGHIVVADTADAIVVAPATAHWLAAMATGLAGDSVTAACLATTAPVIVAPAMDGEMYAHPATQANVGRLAMDFDYTIVEPERGPLASGQHAVGRLADVGRIVEAVVEAVEGRPIRAPEPEVRPPVAPAPREADLSGRHVVVTAGGTAEPIDPVRYIGNRSTGKMGIAVAEAALDRGARVTLICGQTSVPTPAGAEVVRAESTGQMRSALLATTVAEDGSAGFDALVMAAAIADFRPVRPAETKLTRGERLRLELESTPDLLAEISRIANGVDASGARTREPLDPRPVLVGFAAETGSLDRAGEKLTRKGVDFLVANDVSEVGSGFGTDTNRVTIHARDGSVEALPLLSKREVADLLLDLVAHALDARDAGSHTGPESAATPAPEEISR
jgi:phosphopantothenoylcysteine decarboxylase/phosphopantothenate--cysteine ligase